MYNCRSARIPSEEPRQCPRSARQIGRSRYGKSVASVAKLALSDPKLVDQGVGTAVIVCRREDTGMGRRDGENRVVLISFLR